MDLTIHCPAKVNLALSVGSPNEQGMHPICSWMIAVDLVDDLHVQRLAEADESTFDITFAPDAPQVGPIDWPIESDLVYRAHRMIQQETGRSLPVRVDLAKRIPAGMGLAGGSSDAAGMIKALNQLFDLSLSSQRMGELSRQLGSDIPFFFGDGSAIVSGLGEDLTAAPPARAIDLLVLLPACQCPTGQVYQQFDRLHVDQSHRSPDAQAVESLVAMSPLPADAPFNDLGPAAQLVEPQLAPLRQACEARLHRPVHITGSGAGMFVVCENADEARAMARMIQATVDLAARPVSSIRL
jgi:4-diphosphocytidyl-2C-methyl-D-erythritol kinase